jgi:hypothetical protein
MAKKQKDARAQTPVPEKKRETLTELTEDNLGQIHGGTKSKGGVNVNEIHTIKSTNTSSSSPFS